MKGKYFVVLLVIVLSFGLGATVSAQKITWRMASSWPAGTELMYQADLFAKKVTTMSGGRLEIKSFAGGAIVAPLEVFDAVNRGSIDASHSWSGYWIGKQIASPMFASMPMGMDTPQYYTWFYQAGGIALWREMYAKYNFGFVGPCGNVGAEDFGWSHKPLRTLADFKGLKYRTVGFWGEILNQLGASVVTLPGGEVYPALEKKVIDAGEYSSPAIDYKLAFHEICKYLHGPAYHQQATILELIVNKKSWDKLPKDLQAIVEEAAKSTTLEGWVHGIKEDMFALKKFKEYGTQFVKISPEVAAEIKKRAEALYDQKAAKDPFFAKVLKSQRDFLKEYDIWEKQMVPRD